MKQSDFNDDFGEYGGSSAGLMEERKWSYPSFGYNSEDGIFMMGSEDDPVNLESVILIPLAIRQCRESIEKGTKKTRRYSLYTSDKDMAPGKHITRLQVACWVNDQLMIFGGKSWTMRSVFVNPPADDDFHDKNYPVGLWYRLAAYIKKVKAEKKIVTAPYCYAVQLTVSDKVMKVASKEDPGQSSKVHPIDVEFMGFVGPEMAQKMEQLYVDEELADWVKEWKLEKGATVAVKDSELGDDQSVGEEWEESAPQQNGRKPAFVRPPEPDDIPF